MHRRLILRKNAFCCGLGPTSQSKVHHKLTTGVGVIRDVFGILKMMQLDSIIFL